MAFTPTTIHPLTVGAAYLVTFHPTTTRSTVTKALKVTEILETGAPHPVTGKRAMAYIFHGPRGGKEVLTPAEVLAAVPTTK